MAHFKKLINAKEIEEKGTRQEAYLKGGDAVVDIFKNVIFGNGQKVVHRRDVVHCVRQNSDLKLDFENWIN